MRLSPESLVDLNSLLPVVDSRAIFQVRVLQDVEKSVVSPSPSHPSLPSMCSRVSVVIESYSLSVSLLLSLSLSVSLPASLCVCVTPKRGMSRSGDVGLVVKQGH